jgi:hypothetical protein
MNPSIVSHLLLVVTPNLSSMTITRQKELGTLEQLNVTPVAKASLRLLFDILARLRY